MRVEIGDDEYEESHEVLDQSRCELEFQRRTGEHYEHGGGNVSGGGIRGFLGELPRIGRCLGHT
jgi:hypothetical protein